MTFSGGVYRATGNSGIAGIDGGVGIDVGTGADPGVSADPDCSSSGTCTTGSVSLISIEVAENSFSVLIFS